MKDHDFRVNKKPNPVTAWLVIMHLWQHSIGMRECFNPKFKWPWGGVATTEEYR